MAVGKTGPHTKPIMAKPIKEKFVNPIKEILIMIKTQDVITISVGENFLTKGKITILPAAKLKKNIAKALAPI
jgi:hypothetical protein